jgi:hypothetical protein
MTIKRKDSFADYPRQIALMIQLGTLPSREQVEAASEPITSLSVAGPALRHFSGYRVNQDLGASPSYLSRNWTYFPPTWRALVARPCPSQVQRAL